MAAHPVRPDDLGSVLVRGLHRRQLLAADAAAGAGYALVLCWQAALARPRPPLPASAGLALLVGLAVALRRPVPLPALVTVLVATTTGLVTGLVHDPFGATALVVYVVAQRPRRPPVVPLRVLAGLAVAAALLATVAGTPAPAPQLFEPLLEGAVLVAGAAALGRVVQLRRFDAARAAHEHAQRAALAERLRIAREMHDVVTHGLGLITVQAGIANHVADRRPEAAREALAVIEATGREALAEMRRMLGVLRSEDPATAPGTPGPPEPAQPPGPAAGLAVLVARARAAGVTVEAAVPPGAVDGLPAAVGTAVHRVVQECLTNVVRHAPGARCRIGLDRAPDRLVVTVSDGGAGTPGPVAAPPAAPPAGPLAAPDGGGRGLLGMQERVAALGGRLVAGPRPDGGFEVRATIPLPDAPPAAAAPAQGR